MDKSVMNTNDALVSSEERRTIKWASKNNIFEIFPFNKDDSPQTISQKHELIRRQEMRPQLF